MSSHAECGRRVTEEAALPNNPDVGALSSVPPSLLNDLRSNSPGRLHWSRSTTQEISWQLCVWPAASTWTPRTPKNLVFFVPWRTLHFFRSHTHAPRRRPISLPYLHPLLLFPISLLHLFYRQHKKHVFVQSSPVSVAFTPSSSSILYLLISCLTQCFLRLPAPSEVSRRGVVAATHARRSLTLPSH